MLSETTQLVNGTVPAAKAKLESSQLATKQTGWAQLPLSLKAKLNQTVLTWEFPVLNVYLLV